MFEINFEFFKFKCVLFLKMFIVIKLICKDVIRCRIVRVDKICVLKLIWSFFNLM